jgi:hypothetical protein
MARKQEAPENTLPDYITEGDGYAEITLMRPLDVDGTKVPVVRMREPTVQDQLTMEANKGSDAEKEIGLMANLCMMAPGDVKKMPLRDFKRLQVAYVNFLD